MVGTNVNPPCAIVTLVTSGSESMITLDLEGNWTRCAGTYRGRPFSALLRDPSDTSGVISRASVVVNS